MIGDALAVRRRLSTMCFMASHDEEGLPRSLWNWWKLRRHAASVDGEPWMDPAALARYKEVLGESGQHYLEFGSGGSTR